MTVSKCQRVIAHLLVLWCSLSLNLTNAQEDELMNNNDTTGKPEGYEPPTISISGSVTTPVNEQESNKVDFNPAEMDERLAFLTDEWWKILIWVLGFLFLFCLCCYCSR